MRGAKRQRAQLHLALPALLLILLAGRAEAILSMEGLHLGVRQDGFSGEVDLAASGASGNTERSDIAAGTRLEWHRERHTDLLVASHAYGRAAGVTNTDKSFLHLRHIYQRVPDRAWEGFVQAERDEFARLSYRGLIGGGARFTLIERTDERAAFFGLGAMYVRERLTEVAGLTDHGTETLWRGNLYFVIKYRVREGIALVNSTYYQPALSEPSDYRLLDTAELKIDLTGQLALKLSIGIVHDSRPPQSVRGTDVTYRTGLSWSF